MTASDTDYCLAIYSVFFAAQDHYYLLILIQLSLLLSCQVLLQM